MRAVKYVAGLDGLRAVAVIAVLAFHAEFSVVGGGFLGVSLFFTLSGFLITTLLLDEYESTGALSFRRFYGRRVRRLLPAAYACLLLVVGLSGWWVANQRRELPGDLVASVANVANWRFAFSSTRYQDLFISEPSPVAHFWSLAIEEQIYLVLPVVVWLALRRGRRTLAVTTGVLLCGSIAATLLTTDRDLVYNGTHTRAAELLVGVALAQALFQWQRAEVPARSSRTLRGRVAQVVGRSRLSGGVALGVFVALVVTSSLQQSWIYQGGLVGVALVSAVLIAAVADGRFPARLLEAGALVAIGKVSYGIYLYHWPVFLLLDEQRTGLDRVSLFVLRCLVTLVLTYASYQLIEQPIRRGRVIRRDRVMVPAMAAAAAVVAVAAVLVVPAPTLTATEALLELGDEDVVEFAPVPPPAGLVDLDAAPGAVDAAPGTADAVPDISPPPRPRIAVLGSDAPTVAALRTNEADAYDVIDAVRPDCPLSSIDDTGCERLLDRWETISADGAADVLVLVTNDAEADDAESQRTGVISDEQLRAVAAAEEAMIDENLAVIDSALESGVDVVWYTPAPQTSAFFRHFARIGVERPAARTVVGDAATLAVAVDEVLSTRDDRGSSDISSANGLRVLVIGDSTSLSFARALNDGSDGGLTVLWAGANGCPFAPVEATRGQSAGEWSESECVAWHEKVPPLIDSFGPDVLFVMTGPMDLVEHRFAGDPTGRAAGDPEFAAARDAEIEQLLAGLPPELPVLVADLPTITVGGFSGPEMTSPERLAAVNAQIVDWDERSLQVSRFAYRDALEAAEATLPPGERIRSDGTHPDVEPLAELARATYVPQLIAQVAELRSELG